MIGLSKTSTTKEIIDKVDKNTAIRYRVVKEKIDLEGLKKERDDLVRLQKEPKLTEKELVKSGLDEYEVSQSIIQTRLDEIDSLLKG